MEADCMCVHEMCNDLYSVSCTPAAKAILHAVCININPSSTPLETIQKLCKMEHENSMSIPIFQPPVGHQLCQLLSRGVNSTSADLHRSLCILGVHHNYWACSEGHLATDNRLAEHDQAPALAEWVSSDLTGSDAPYAARPTAHNTKWPVVFWSPEALWRRTKAPRFSSRDRREPVMTAG